MTTSKSKELHDQAHAAYRQEKEQAPKSNTPLENLAAEIKELHDRELEIGYDELDALWARQKREYDELDASFEPQRLPLRVERGRLLIEARKLVPGQSWEKWCGRHLPNMSQSDIRACIALAEADDPVAACETAKTRAREGMRKTREQRKGAVTAVDVTAESPAESPAAPIELPAEVVRDAPLRIAALAASSDLRLTATPEPVEPPQDELVRDNNSDPTAYLDALANVINAPQAKINQCNEALRAAVRDWWMDADEDERLAFGKWFDELRQADTPTSDDAPAAAQAA